MQQGNDEQSASPEGEAKMEQLLRGYVETCHNTALEFLKTKQSLEAGKMLHQCKEFIVSGVTPTVAQMVLKKGILHTVFNNLAQYANMTGDMDSSIEYLEKAVEAAERQEVNQNLLPLAETYLNLANGYSFQQLFKLAQTYSEKANKVAKVRCEKLLSEVHEERSKGISSQDTKLDSLQFQLNDLTAVQIMAQLCMGEQHEKLGDFSTAIKIYNEGKLCTEEKFGKQH